MTTETTPTTSYLVLCVDDDAPFLQSLGGIVRKALDGHPLARHCEVELGCGPDECREILAEAGENGDEVAVLITDQIMPGCSGLELIEEMKPKHPDTSCVLLTGYAGLESARYAINKQLLDRYTSKPIEAPDEFAAIIVSELERFHLRRTQAIQAERIETQDRALRDINLSLERMKRTAENVAYFFREMRTLEIDVVLDQMVEWLPRLFEAKCCFLFVPDPHSRLFAGYERRCQCLAPPPDGDHPNALLLEAEETQRLTMWPCRGPCVGSLERAHDERGCIVLPIRLPEDDAAGGPRTATLCLGGIEGEGALSAESVEYKGMLINDVVGANIRHALTYSETLRLANEDALTGVRNRRAFEEALRVEWERFRRAQSEFCFVMIDMDNFKAINDTHGHDTGDEAIRALGAVLSEHVRSCDLVARFGGDEFAVLLPATDVDGARIAASRLHAKINESELPGTDLGLGVSIGIASAKGKSSAAELLRSADTALYAAKSRGRGRIAIFEDGLPDGSDA